MVTLYHSRYYWMFQQHSTANCQFHADNLINHENNIFSRWLSWLTDLNLFDIFMACVWFSPFFQPSLSCIKVSRDYSWHGQVVKIMLHILFSDGAIRSNEELPFSSSYFFLHNFFWSRLYLRRSVSDPTSTPVSQGQGGHYLHSWWCSICPSDLINGSIVCMESVVVSRRL